MSALSRSLCRGPFSHGQSGPFSVTAVFGRRTAVDATKSKNSDVYLFRLQGKCVRGALTFACCATSLLLFHFAQEPSYGEGKWAIV